MSHNPMPFHYLFLPSLINRTLFITYVENFYLYIIIPCSKDWSRSQLTARARILNFCIIAEKELTFRKRPSWKPQQLVTMSHSPMPFHYLFLPGLINPKVFTTYHKNFYLHIIIPCSKGWSRSQLIVRARILNSCIIAERELAFRKRPS